MSLPPSSPSRRGGGKRRQSASSSSPIPTAASSSPPHATKRLRPQGHGTIAPAVDMDVVEWTRLASSITTQAAVFGTAAADTAGMSDTGSPDQESVAASTDEPQPVSLAMRLIDPSTKDVKLQPRILNSFAGLWTYISSIQGRATPIPPIPIPATFQANKHEEANVVTVATTVGDLIDIGFANRHQDGGEQAWVDAAQRMIARHVGEKPVVYHHGAPGSDSFIATRWVHPSPTAAGNELLVDRSNNGRYLVGIEPIATSTPAPPTAETVTDSPPTTVATLEPTSSTSAATLATAQGPIVTPLTTCTHESVPNVDLLLSGVRPTLGRQLCLPCVATRATAIADSAAAGLSQARWDALLAAHAPETGLANSDEYTAVQALRDNAGHIVSDAWFEAVQLAGIALGVEHPTSPIFVNKVAAVALERVAADHSGGESTEDAAVRVAVVKTALKDVAHELLLSVYSKGEGTRSSSPRELVDKAVDMALAESLGGEESGQARLMGAMTEVWNQYYQGITFESLVSKEEWAKVNAHGSIEEADEAAQAAQAKETAEAVKPAARDSGGEESELSDLSDEEEEGTSD